MNDVELKPCKCGCEAELVESQSFAWCHTLYFVRCTSLDCDKKTDKYLLKGEAVEAWNAKAQRHERTTKMLEMSKSGISYDEIGKTFDISKQRVCSLIGGQLKHHFRPISPESCVYPNLRKWMNDNHVSNSELSRRLYGNTSGTNQEAIRYFLRGKGRDTRKSVIDKYLAITGLTYEELFETEGTDNEQTQT